MGTRDDVLAAIRRNRPAGRHDLPALPDFPPLVRGDLAAAFGEGLRRMGGRLAETGPGADLLAVLRERLAGAGAVASAVPEVGGDRDLGAVAHPRDLADVDVAVVRAVLGVAETGSVLFTQDELRVNALAYLAQHLIVLLDPADLVVDVQALYRRPEFGSAAYAVLHTGPSATADIEGVLIHGAQGVRSLSVFLLPRGGPET